MKLKDICLLTFLILFLSSCSWVSETWKKRPDWIMPDKGLNQQLTGYKVSKELLTGFNISLSISETKKLISDNGFDYKKRRLDKKSQIQTFNFEGTLFDTKNLFTYKAINSSVDFFDDTILSSRVRIDASNENNLEEIVNAVYQILVDFYSSPLSENSIYSFQIYKWAQNDVEVFLSIDKEHKSILISEVNSIVEESRSFQEFKEEFIDDFQTYEEEIRYGKNRDK